MSTSQPRLIEGQNIYKADHALKRLEDPCRYVAL